MAKKLCRISNVKTCIFCGIDEDNELIFGKFVHKARISAHENCVMFSSGLEQRAKARRDGLIGFLIRDVKKEILRGRKLHCCYCKKVGATVGCILKKCKRSFHFPCGIKNHTLHQYYDNFPSYCDLHKPRQISAQIKEDMNCYICRSSIPKDSLDDCLYSPCCKNEWFHRMCMQQYALSAGMHFFRCPLCNNTSEFVQEMLEHGIHIPKKDADWELDENAYQELLTHPECNATKCKCVSGKNYNGRGIWGLLPCSECGGCATHKYCGELGVRAKTWTCDDCKEILAQIERNKRVIEATRAKLLRYPYNAALIDEFTRCMPRVKIVLQRCDFQFTK